MNENKEKTAGNLANSVVEGYDYSVAVRMSGRAGAYSPTGGKGNAFEVMYSDKKNLSNLLKPDTTTTLTNSSTARQVDLVTKKGNRIIERIQCKDTPSAKGTMDTIKRVQNGQYRTTQLVGTSESGGIYRRRIPRQSGCYLRLRQRLFRRLHYGTHQTCLTRAYSGNPHPECLRNRSPYPAVGPRRHGARRLHLHRRIRIRTGRNHADGKDFPARLRSTPQHDCFP